MYILKVLNPPALTELYRILTEPLHNCKTPCRTLSRYPCCYRGARGAAASSPRFGSSVRASVGKVRLGFRVLGV